MGLKNDDIRIFVWDVDPIIGSFKLIGEISHFESLMWCQKVRDFGEFNLVLPLSDKNLLFITNGKIISISGKSSAMLIDVVNFENKNGVKKASISGRSIDAVFTWRILERTEIISGILGDNIQRIVDSTFTNSLDPAKRIRTINFISMPPYTDVITRFQRSAGTVYDLIMQSSSINNLSFLYTYFSKDEISGRLRFFEDATESSTTGNLLNIVLDTESGVVLSSIYNKNTQNNVTYARIAGEGEGLDRVIVGIERNNPPSTNWNKREIYVDARDLQRKIIDASGNEITIGIAEYRDMLSARGYEKLAERVIIEKFDFELNLLDNRMINFVDDIHLYLGAFITVYDNIFGIKANVQITEFKEFWDNKGHKLSLIFGPPDLTIQSELKSLRRF
jgi:hypothetical protein